MIDEKIKTRWILKHGDCIMTTIDRYYCECESHEAWLKWCEDNFEPLAYFLAKAGDIRICDGYVVVYPPDHAKFTRITIGKNYTPNLHQAIVQLSRNI